MQTPFSVQKLLDTVIGWQGAAPNTRARLLEAFCSSIRPSSIVSNSITALLVGAFVLAGTHDALYFGWLLAALLGGIMPRAYAARLRRRKHFDRHPERKALVFVGISAVYGLIWGAGPLLVLPGISGTREGVFLVIIIFGTVMGPYAAMPGILYARLVTTGIPTVLAIGLNSGPALGFIATVLAGWLVLRTDAWRAYHRTLRREMELRETLETQRTAVERAHLATKQANDDLKVLADTDPLTGVANRRQFVRRIETLTPPAAALLFDVDRFKSINDRFGHHTGDAVLVELVRLVEGILRAEDLLARLGGDEFAVVLPGAGTEQAWTIAERIRERVDGRRVRIQGHEVHFTISVGLATATDEAGATDIPTLLHTADQLLYAAKRRGRNQICSDTGLQRKQPCGS